MGDSPEAPHQDLYLRIINAVARGSFIAPVVSTCLPRRLLTAVAFYGNFHSLLHPTAREKPHIFELNWTLFFLPYNRPVDLQSFKSTCSFNDAVCDQDNEASNVSMHFI
jgi:hypothetical protein